MWQQIRMRGPQSAARRWTMRPAPKRIISLSINETERPAAEAESERVHATSCGYGRLEASVEATACCWRGRRSQGLQQPCRIAPVQRKAPGFAHLFTSPANSLFGVTGLSWQDSVKITERAIKFRPRKIAARQGRAACSSLPTVPVPAIPTACSGSDVYDNNLYHMVVTLRCSVASTR
jgi:hypothetical protein